MQHGVTRFLLLLSVVLSSGCPTGKWNEQALAYRQPPASATVYQPRRPRVSYAPPELSNKLHASRIEVHLVDGRPTQQVLLGERPALSFAVPDRMTEVQLPVAIEARASARVGSLTVGAGPVLSLEGRVTQLSVIQEDRTRTITSRIAWSLQDAAGTEVYAAASEAGYALRGLAYDRAELDEIHALAVLASLDGFLSKPEVIELINLKLTHVQTAPLPGSQQL